MSTVVVVVCSLSCCKFLVHLRRGLVQLSMCLATFPRQLFLVRLAFLRQAVQLLELLPQTGPLCRESRWDLTIKLVGPLLHLD